MNDLLLGSFLRPRSRETNLRIEAATYERHCFTSMMRIGRNLIWNSGLFLKSSGKRITHAALFPSS